MARGLSFFAALLALGSSASLHAEPRLLTPLCRCLGWGWSQGYHVCEPGAGACPAGGSAHSNPAFYQELVAPSHMPPAPLVVDTTLTGGTRMDEGTWPIASPAPQDSNGYSRWSTTPPAAPAPGAVCPSTDLVVAAPAAVSAAWPPFGTWAIERPVPLPSVQPESRALPRLPPVH